MILSLNRDLQLLVVATPEPQGYRVFLIDGSKCDLLHCHKGKKIFLIGCVPRCLVGYIVLQDSQKQLLICDLEKDKILQRKVYKNEILAVKMSLKIIVIIMQDQIFIHNNIEDIMMGRYMDIPRNPKGIGALAEEAPYFAYPWYENTENMSVETLNSVQIRDVSAKGNRVMTTIFQDGLPNIAAIGLIKTGELIAIANTEGKYIRLFAVKSGHMITEFHRGWTQVAIDSLYFSECKKYLISTSNIKTVQIFLLNLLPDSLHSQQSVKVLPEKAQEKATEFLNSNSSFAKANLILEQEGTGSVCRIKIVGNQTRLLVASPSGNLNVFILPEKKGNCKYHETFDLLFREEKKTELNTLAAHELIQIDDSTKSECLLSRAAASLRKKFASAPTSGALNFPSGSSSTFSRESSPPIKASTKSASLAALHAAFSTSEGAASALATGSSTSAVETAVTNASDEEEETSV